MVKTPNMRHSKPRRQPVTIDLQAASVETPKPAETAKPAEAPKAAETTRPAAAAPGVSAQSKPIEAEVTAKPAATEAARPERGPDMSKPDETAKAAAPKDPPKPETRSSIPPRPPVDEPRRSGSMSIIAAGLIGGVVALAGAGALQWGGVLPSFGENNQTILESRINELQSQVAALPVPVDYTGRLDALDQQLRQTAEAVAAGGAEVAQGLSERIKAVEDGLAAAKSSISAASDTAAVNLAPVNDRLVSIEAGLTEAANAVRAAASSAAEANNRISVLEKTMGDISGKVAEQAAQPNAALAIAASALKAAIDRGEPFVTEVNTFAAIAPPSPEIDQLRQMAAAGVASRAAIEAAFPAAASAIVSAGRVEDPNAGFFDKLLSSAQSLVDVRPVGMVEGEGAAEIVARMEVHLKAGDYAAAVAEYDKLPEPAKAAGASFIGLVKARQAADGLTDAVLASALKA